MEEKRIKIEDFVNKANGNKKYDFAQHITRKYMPYAEKVSLVKSIVDTSSYDEVEGRKIYRRNTSNMLFLFTMQMIEKYTNFEIESDKVSQSYDLLMSTGLMRPILEQIPESETMILREMLDAQRDDEEVNTRSLVSFLETKTDAMQLAIDALLGALSQPEIQAQLSQNKK